MPNTSYKLYGKKYYEANRAKTLERNKKNQSRWRQAWHDFKATLSCAHCGASHPAIFDFHHVDPTDPDKKKINTLIKKHLYSQAYKEVAEKCIVLCANCHRIHHYNEHKNKKDPPPP